MQALHSVAVDRLRQRSFDQHAVACLAQMVADLTGRQTDYYDFNMASKSLSVMEYKSLLPVNSAILLVDLYNSGELPPWVILELDLPAWKMVVPNG